MCAFSFVPEERGPEIFDMWHNEIPDEFLPVATYFETTYTQKNVWGTDKKMLRSEMGKCNFPVSDQLLVQFGQIFV